MGNLLGKCTNIVCNGRRNGIMLKGEEIRERKGRFFNKILWLLRRDILVADYAQNLNLPNFGGDQPGYTYYYSPSKINVFGVLDCTVEVMDACIYTEVEGKKGGNYVVLLLQKCLQKKSVLGMLKKWVLENVRL